MNEPSIYNQLTKLERVLTTKIERYNKENNEHRERFAVEIAKLNTMFVEYIKMCNDKEEQRERQISSMSENVDFLKTKMTQMNGFKDTILSDKERMTKRKATAYISVISGVVSAICFFLKEAFINFFGGN